MQIVVVKIRKCHDSRTDRFTLPLPRRPTAPKNPSQGSDQSACYDAEWAGDENPQERSLVRPRGEQERPEETRHQAYTAADDRAKCGVSYLHSGFCYMAPAGEPPADGGNSSGRQDQAAPQNCEL